MNYIRLYFSQFWDPNSYKLLLYLLLSFVLGLVEFVVLVVGVSLGVGTLIVMVGAPVLVGTAWLLLKLMDAERWLAKHLLDQPLESVVLKVHKGSWLEGVKEMMTSPELYKAVLYSLVRFVLGILGLVLVSCMLAFLWALVALPFGEKFGAPTWTWAGHWNIVLCITVVVILMQLCHLLGMLWRLINAALLVQASELRKGQLELRAVAQSSKAVTMADSLHNTVAYIAQETKAACTILGVFNPQGEVLYVPEASQASALLQHSAQPPQVIQFVTLPKSNPMVVLPVAYGDQCLGQVFFAHHHKHIYDHDVEFLSAIAYQIATAIQTYRLIDVAKTSAVSNERDRLARELHDSVAQALYGITLATKTAQAWVGRDGDKALESLKFATDLSQGASAEMKSLLFNLRSDALEEGGLIEALSRQAETLELRYKLQVKLQASSEPSLRQQHKRELFKIAQEALHNVVKHAKASQVNIVLEQHGSSYTLTIADNGIGFDALADSTNTVGLKSMRERAAQAGGLLEVQSGNLGTTIRITVAKEVQS